MFILYIYIFMLVVFSNVVWWGVFRGLALGSIWSLFGSQSRPEFGPAWSPNCLCLVSKSVLTCSAFGTCEVPVSPFTLVMSFVPKCYGVFGAMLRVREFLTGRNMEES